MNEESLFHEALARPDPRGRSAFLDEACAGRPVLRVAVESLLAAHDQSSGFLNSPVVAGLDLAGGATPETRDLISGTDPETGHSGIDAPGAAVRTHSVPGSEGEPPGRNAPERVGRYTIQRLLGRGGMGAVYLAHDPELDRTVALKVPQLAGPNAEERFLREARAAAALSHPNLCPVYDAGRADGVLYLAMAYVPGPTLSDVIRQDGALPPARAAEIAAGVARGMAEAHRHGIVHRDLKPGNILLNLQGEPVITDFGLALRSSIPEVLTDAEAIPGRDPRLTQAGVIMGTPAYMPPEQARGDLAAIGAASDVYALGAILFEMLTGRTVFPGSNIHEILKRIQDEPAPAPSSVRPGIPRGFDAACRRAMAKDPTDRFASMDAFAGALAPFAPRRRNRIGRIVGIAAAAFLLLFAAGVVIYVKTDHGTVEVRLNDPSADVQVTVDGEVIRVNENGRVTELTAGPHALEVRGPGFETETRVFKVKRGEQVVLEVELTPTRPQLNPGPEERSRLASILVRGRKAIDEGRVSEVGAIADQALSIDPESPGALALRATFRFAVENDPENARADADAALKLNPRTRQALIVRAAIASQEERSSDAIADETVAIGIEPTHPAAWSNRSLSYFECREYRQAIADATRAIELGIERPDAFLNRGAALAFLGDYARSIAEFDAAAKLAPNDSRVFEQRSAVYAKMGNDELAAADWKRAKSLNETLRIEDRPVIPDPPTTPERKKLSAEEAEALAAVLQDAETAWGLNHFDDCAKACEEAVRIDPTCAQARSLRARIWAEKKRSQDAVAEADEALRLDPENAQAYFVRGTARSDLGDPAAAVADLTVAVRLDPANPFAWNNRGWAFHLRGQYHQAVADLTEAVRLDPDSAEAHANRAMCRVHQGKYEEALADYSKAAGLQPTVGRWRLVIAAVRAKLGDADGSRDDREAAIRIDGQLKDAPAITLPTPLPPVKVDPR